MVPGTETYIDAPGLMSFSSVSLRGDAIYRTRPEQGYGFCRHAVGVEKAAPLSPAASICPPILVKDHAIYGGLDGALHIVPLEGSGKSWNFPTPLGSPITAPAAVADGRVVYGGEDGYLYVLAPGGKTVLKAENLAPYRIRTALSGKYADPKYDWYTNYGNMGCTNSNAQGITPPLRMRWIARLDGTVKHIPVCGGGRIYTHTAEGQVIAMEQETGRILWRTYRPGVFLSFTSPLYHQEKLLVPQSGIHGSVICCLDAATGRQLWEAPFTGSASWSRQFPPVIQGNLAIYASGSGKYAPAGSAKAYAWNAVTPTSGGEEVMSFIYSHDNPYYPLDSKPRIWAWDLDTGKLVWEKDFSEYGAGGNDCGIALMDGELYYSTFFGYQSAQKRRRGEKPGVNGMTAALNPATGEVRWVTTDYYVTAGCTVTAKDGRLYLGGFNQHEGTLHPLSQCQRRQSGLAFGPGGLGHQCDIGRRQIPLLQRPRLPLPAVRPGHRKNRLPIRSRLRLHPLHPVRALPHGGEHGHDRSARRAQTGGHRSGGGLSGMSRVRRFERPHFLRLPSQRLGHVRRLRGRREAPCPRLGNALRLLGRRSPTRRPRSPPLLDHAVLAACIRCITSTSFIQIPFHPMKTHVLALATTLLLIEGLFPSPQPLRAGEREREATAQQVAASEDLPTTEAEARGRARMLYETIHGTLQVVHRDFFGGAEDLNLPSQSLEDVFKELAVQSRVRVRWLGVNATKKADHNPQDDFERKAAQALLAGKKEYAEREGNLYRYVGTIRIQNECLKCHVPNRTSLEDRVAGLAISIPLRNAPR